MAKRTRKPGQVIPKGPNKWLARAFLGRGADGKRRYHSRVLRGSKKDAQRYLNKVHREIDLGEFVEPSDQPLREYLSEWVVSVVAARVSEPTNGVVRASRSRWKIVGRIRGKIRASGDQAQTISTGRC